MPRLKMSHPNAGPVELELPGFGAYTNGETYTVSDEWVERWMAHHTTETLQFDAEGNVTGVEVQVRDFPLGVTIEPDEDEEEGELTKVRLKTVEEDPDTSWNEGGEN